MSVAIVETDHGPYRISTDPSLVDVDVVHRFLSEESYWAVGQARDVVERSIEHSPLVVGAYREGRQVGFARMVTDLTTFAWLCDVFVLDEARGSGVGVAMVRTVVEHPAVVGIKRQFLATADAHGLYARFGYEPLTEPERWMIRPGTTT